MLGRRRRPVPDGKIEKPEDGAWKEWFEGLDVKEHEKHLQQLGLDKEDIEEWELTGGYKKKNGPEKQKKRENSQG